MCIITEYDFPALNIKKVRNRIFFSEAIGISFPFITSRIKLFPRNAIWFGCGLSQAWRKLFWKSSSRCSSPEIAAEIVIVICGRAGWRWINQTMIIRLLASILNLIKTQNFLSCSYIRATFKLSSFQTTRCRKLQKLRELRYSTLWVYLPLYKTPALRAIKWRYITCPGFNQHSTACSS